MIVPQCSHRHVFQVAVGTRRTRELRMNVQVGEKHAAGSVPFPDAVGGQDQVSGSISPGLSVREARRTSRGTSEVA